MVIAGIDIPEGKFETARHLPLENMIDRARLAKLASEARVLSVWKNCHRSRIAIIHSLLLRMMRHNRVADISKRWPPLQSIPPPFR
jgi:hypothetical protein